MRGNRRGAGVPNYSEVFSKPLEERVPDLPFCRLRAVLDLGFQPGLDPDIFVGDPLRECLRLPDERLQPPPELGGRGLVKTVVDLAGVDEIVALAPTDVEAVPLGAVE